MNRITEENRRYWDAHADLWFGTTALPQWGVLFPREEELRVFDGVAGKKVLEVCCGSGHSLLYLARRGAAELWGVDLSRAQLDNAERLLQESGVTARLLCTPMEEMTLPENHFDMAFSIYGIGWATDLDAVFQKIAAGLKPGGAFAFSWHHPLYYCIARDHQRRQDVLGAHGELILSKSCFDEEWFRLPVDDSEVLLCNRRLSTWVNALARAGFILERMVEGNDPAQVAAQPEGPRKEKAKMLPVSVLFLARKR